MDRVTGRAQSLGLVLCMRLSVCVLEAGWEGLISSVEIQAGDADGDSPSSTGEVSPY